MCGEGRVVVMVGCVGGSVGVLMRFVPRVCMEATGDGCLGWDGCVFGSVGG